MFTFLLCHFYLCLRQVHIVCIRLFDTIDLSTVVITHMATHGPTGTVEELRVCHAM